MYEAQPQLAVAPADSVSVVGFPFGKSIGGAMAIWATGFLASEPNIDVNDLPLQLIDCRARQGQSGSPVIAYRSSGAIALSNGDTVVMSGSVTLPIGVYSGRINTESDIGLVWKFRVVREIVAAADAMLVTRP